jgi:hypothetical protein
MRFATNWQTERKILKEHDHLMTVKSAALAVKVETLAEVVLKGGVTSCRRCWRGGITAKGDDGEAGHGKEWQFDQESG